jgi:transcriptional regulator
VWSSSADTEVLAVFQAADAYISPNWYPTKQETHEVVPTWNYAVVHAWGQLVVHEDEKWVRGAVGKLTQAMERASDRPWKMGDAPQDYIRSMLGNIVGIEIPIQRIIGKWKANQNRNDADRNGTIDGLRTRATENDLLMADLIKESQR